MLPAEHTAFGNGLRVLLLPTLSRFRWLNGWRIQPVR